MADPLKHPLKHPLKRMRAMTAMTAPPLSLAQLVSLPSPPPELLRLAAATGCTGVGLRLRPSAPGGPFHDLIGDPALLRQTQAVMRDTGVRILDLEVLRLTPEVRIADFEPLLATGQALGARHLLVSGEDGEPQRLRANFHALCEAAAAHGLSADLEFMPWTAVSCLREAVAVLRDVDHPAAGLLVDALHLFRSDSPLDELAQVPAHWLHYAQICDARRPAPTRTEDLIHDARQDRLLPGEGDFPLADLLALLPPTLPLSIEIPSVRRLQVLGAPAWAAQAAQAVRALLARTGRAPG